MAPPTRTAVQLLGTSRTTATAPRTGKISDTNGIGCTPVNGKSSAEQATTAGGGRATANIAAGRRASSSEAATTSRNSPATGLAAVASAASSTASAARVYRAGRLARPPRQRAGQVHTTATAPSPNSTPSAKVTRPEAALHAKAKAPHSEGTSGRDTVRASSSDSRPADSTPETISVVRTPMTAIR